jgi:hypothetical protein
LKRLLILFSIGILSLAGCTHEEAYPPPSLEVEPLFASGFSEDVMVDPEYIRWNQWVGLISGVDNTTKSDWDQLGDTLSVDVLGFQPLVHADTPNPEEYTVNKIIDAPDRFGKTNKVLMQLVLKDDPNMGSLSRSNYLLNPNPGRTQGYQSSWIYLQPDLLEKISANGIWGWRQLWEMKCATHGIPGDFSWTFRYYVTITWNQNDGLHWRLEGQNEEHYGTNETEWAYKPQTRVPVGEWFQFEVFWKSGENDGRFWVRLHGKGGDVLCDHTGRTIHSPEFPAAKWNLMKCYTAERSFPAWQYVDNLEVFDALPRQRR